MQEDTRELADKGELRSQSRSSPMTAEENTVREVARHAKALMTEFDSDFVDEMRVVPWVPEKGYFELIVRAAVIRQHEGFGAIADLVLMERGDAAVALLRPACEELIVLRYLMTIDRKDAEALLVLLAQRDIDKALAAQHEYSGADAMRELGLTRLYESRHAKRSYLKNDLRELTKKLGWPKGDRLNVWFMAKKTGEEKLYNFLYHATSRAVHFSVGELMRRCWGKPGEMVLSSNHFEPYWARFALSWGVRLYIDTLVLADDLHFYKEKELDKNVEERICYLAKKIGAAGTMPIITAEELAWPF